MIKNSPSIMTFPICNLKIYIVYSLRPSMVLHILKTSYGNRYTTEMNCKNKNSVI